jgi:hypothetical protein
MLWCGSGKKFKKCCAARRNTVCAEFEAAEVEELQRVRQATHTQQEHGRWVPVNQLQPGDRIRTEDGWATVEAVENTGIWSTVYNIRVADYHTYFVGTPEWGFAAWAHNADCAEQMAALRGIEKRLAEMSLHQNFLLKKSAAHIHREVMHIAETAMQLGISTGRGKHVGQIFQDLLQPLHKKLDQLKSRFNIEIEPGVFEGKRIFGKRWNHERLDAIITEMPAGAQRPALDARLTYEGAGMSLKQKLAALQRLEMDLNYHTIIYGYDISIAHFPVNGHINPLFTRTTGWVKDSVVPIYTPAFNPLARPKFQVFDVRVIGDQFITNDTSRLVRPLVDGVLK